jgi:hypothetical protein
MLDICSTKEGEGAGEEEYLCTKEVKVFSRLWPLAKKAQGWLFGISSFLS